MYDFLKFGISPATILLPKPGYSLEKWAVIACDQFTSQPEYWENVRREAEGAPSTLNIIYPECALGQDAERIESIRNAMRNYRAQVLAPACEGFVLVERQTHAGRRLGLVCAVDLERYDYTRAAKSLIRATEGTIEERLPPRMRIRRGASLESPHVMLLVNDPEHTLIEPIYGARGEMRKLYDFELMLGGGHIRGWAVESPAHMGALHAALGALYGECDGLLFAVGDGNHSLATAKACYEELKKGLGVEAALNHPARFALVEIVNLHDRAMAFRSIHRAVFGADSAQLSHDFVMWCRKNGMSIVSCDDEHAQMYLLDAPVRIENAINLLPVAVLQPFLDEYIAQHEGVSIDYIHGEDALEHLQEQGACAIRLSPIDKFSLFEAVRRGGSLPRKTFSIGDATDKRYYLECRGLTR